ncbi:MAG: hypothetical protein WBR13_09830 [Allosphingosinicella sp.]
MSRTVTAMFDSRSQAEAARDRLTQSRIDTDDVRIVDQGASASSDSNSGEGHGLWSAIKSAFIPPEDSHAYEEGLRRGGYLLCARVDEDCADEAIRILDESGSVDFDARETSWRSEGWSPYRESGGTAGFGESGRTVPGERSPVAGEQPQFGRREAERGGARVRSYVAGAPAGGEPLSVGQRPIDGPVSETDMQSGMLEDRETGTGTGDLGRTEADDDAGVRETAGRSAFGSFGGTARAGTGGSGTGEERKPSDSFEEIDKSRY